MPSTIKCTKNYARFKFIPGNRPVTDSTINIKFREMKRKNLLEAFPIVCRYRASDDKLIIYDGQNRYEAAKKLGLPIYYIVSDDIHLSDIAPINSAQRPWRPRDFLISNVDRGNKDYAELKAFVDETGIPLSVAIALSAGVESGAGGCDGSGFRQGKFVCRDMLHARAVAELINAIKPFAKWVTDRSFVIALSRIRKAVEIDPRRLRQKLEYQSRSLVKCANWQQYVELLDQIYNHHARANDIVPLRAAVRQWMAKSGHAENGAKVAK